jgi:hypothetical protein
LGGRLLVGTRDSFLAAASLLAGSTVAIVVLALLERMRGAWGFVAVAAMLAGGAAALLGWMRAARTATQIAVAEDELIDELDEDRESLENELERREDELRQREAQLARERDGRRIEHAWNRELRQKVWTYSAHRASSAAATCASSCSGPR